MANRLLQILAMLGALGFCAIPLNADATTQSPPTFCKDIAPLIQRHCLACHRVEGAGPFELQTYAQLKRHLAQALKMVISRQMPPWLPEPGFGEFAGDRHLDEATIAIFRAWADAGAPMGEPTNLPVAAPAVSAKWELGEPDLVVRSPKPFALGAEGTDLYHNFAFQTGLTSRRFVRAVELHSGNPRVMHHAFLLLDRSGLAMRQIEKAEQPGINLMRAAQEAYMPDGQNISWQPGKNLCLRADQSSWTLPADADIILEAHLRPQGKPETVWPEIGLYFTDKVPSALFYRFSLRAQLLDIPAGNPSYTATAQYTLPVDVEATAVSAHAHFLGKQAWGYAIMPNGKRVDLLRIKQWNPNLQDTYTFRKAVALPRGSTIFMKWEFDNSPRNPLNPNSPPKRVYFGPNGNDEMGELYLQLRLGNQGDLSTLSRDFLATSFWPESIESLKLGLQRSESNVGAHVELSKLYLLTNQPAKAHAQLLAGLRVDPKCAELYAIEGRLKNLAGNPVQGAACYRKCLELDPELFSARADFALNLAILGQFPESIQQFQMALKLNPRNSFTHVNLGKVYLMAGQHANARTEYERALALDPDDLTAQSDIQRIDNLEKRK